MIDYSSSNESDEWDYSESEISHKFLFFNVLKDGRIHVKPPYTVQIIPPSQVSIPGIKVKDVIISPKVSARIFIPVSVLSKKTRQCPLLFYIHGSGYCMDSPFSKMYTDYVGSLAAEANMVAVSVKYGLFPARPIPECYEDCTTAFSWVASHGSTCSGINIEPWIKEHADLSRVFVAGDSAGGNISQFILSREDFSEIVGEEVKVKGMMLIHPHFGEDDKMWMYMCPTNSGPSDPRLKPGREDLGRTGCGRVLVVLAEKDGLREAGKVYVEELRKSGWKGELEEMENKDRDHCFHITDDPNDPEAMAIQQTIISFINHS